ncbi:MAG: hypothetical protein RLZZ196_21 [Bacteroidota bacterium]
MRIPLWYDVDTSYSTPTAPVPADYLIPWVAITPNSNGTSAVISVGSSVATPASYGGSVAGTGSFNDPDFVINTSSMPYTLNGLTPGSNYVLRIRAYSGSGQTGTYGEYAYQYFTTPKPSSVGGVTGTVSGTQTPGDITQTGTSSAIIGNREVSKSLFIVTNNSTNKDVYSVVTKSTNMVTASYKHFAFGANMFFPAAVANVTNSGGIGFFTSSNGLNGYYVLIQTTESLGSSADKEVKVFKVVNGQKKLLNDSQSSSSKTVTGILSGISYKVDIKVECKSENSINYRIIDIYINNFKITAVDVDTAGSTDPMKLVLPINSSIAMFTSSGKTYFDYIYATPLTEDQYKNTFMQGIVTGFLPAPTMDFLFGKKVISGLNTPSGMLGYYEEFGTTARELRKIKVKYSEPPAYPIYASTGINSFVKIIGQRLNSFGAEIYLLNNAGTYVPLSDGNFYSFTVIGNYVTKSGQIEYTSDIINDSSNPEPITFESMWIQTENDAKSLATWIKDLYTKQQQNISMQIFSNPLISVGDVISVNYPDNGFNGTQKFVVTSVNNSFNQGLETSITARSIYS